VSVRGNPQHRKGGAWADGYGRGRKDERDDILAELERHRRRWASLDAGRLVAYLLERLRSECHVGRGGR
jgi:hypothetical protein